MAAGVVVGGGGGGGGGGYGICDGVGGSNLGALIQTRGVASSSSTASSQPLEGFFISESSPSFMGTGSSMVSFEDVCGRKRTKRPFFRAYDWDENGDDEFDDYFHQLGKKRRLTADQVRFLEKSFEAENKLEPERKVQLAKDLGLQPRQVAIWFQNRRARWKNKQLERDFETLQASFNSLKADYDNLLKEKDQLKAEVVHLSGELHLKEKEPAGREVETSDSENQFQTSSQEPVVDSASEAESTWQQASNGFLFSPSLDDFASATDAFDPECPLFYVDCCHHLVAAGWLADPAANPCYAVEPDCSDVSQDEKDTKGYLNSQENLLPSSSYKASVDIVDVHYRNHGAANSSGFGITVEEEGEEDHHHPPCIWSY